MKAWLRAAWIGIAAALASVPAAAGELHAIVVGFNNYQHMQKLLGAEGDAGDIAAVMRKRGVRDLVVMTDPATTTADFQAAWKAMAARAAPDDTIMFTFAGHGIRVPETRTPKRTPDGYDKGFLFPTYDQDAHPDELLRDEDLYDLFQATALKRLHVLFIADACHAGSGIRGTAPSAPVRFQRFDLRGSDAPTPPSVAVPPRPPIPSVAVISAQIQEKAISEISVDGAHRGALSFAVARALEGAADPEHSGVITVDKLYNYVRQIVRARSGFTQAPGLYDVAADGSMPILSTAPTPTKAEPTKPDNPHPGLPELKEVALFQLGATRADSPLRSIVVEDKSKAELLYDPKGKMVLASTGDILAFNVEPADVVNAVGARQLLNALETLADREGLLTMSLAAGDNLYVEGAKVTVKVANEPFDYLTLFDLTGNGELMLLFPQSGDSQVSHTANPLPTIAVVEPFGADYVVAIRSEKPLESLLGSFSKENKYILGVAEGAPALRAALAGVAVRVGIQGIFTCKKLTEQGQCNSKASSSP